MTATYTNEQLVSLIQNGDNDALNQLYINFTPLILSESKMYLGRMTTYDQDDLMQEGLITIWKAASTFKKGGFGSYLKAALKKHFINLYRDYTLKNMVCIAETDDFGGYGYTTQTLVESDYAKAYREKHRAQCKAWYEKKKASQPPKEPKPKKAPETKEERSKRVMAYQKEYYAAHPDKLAERREKNRIRERERRAAKKAAAMAMA